jgi:hypothetical protein
MIWATGSVDNFFDDPYEILEYSKKLEYKKSTDGSWPGERTESTFNFNKDFFIWTTKKIIALLYPMNFSNIEWIANQYFQKIDGNIFNNNGWVHADKQNELTSIIYLSKHKNCGTNIYDSKKYNCLPINTKQKEESYKNIKKIEEYNKYLIQNNERYEKTISFNSKFNRLIFFDGNQYHAADKFKEENLKEERLTLITFFHSIIGPNIKYPIPEMKRTI